MKIQITRRLLSASENGFGWDDGGEEAAFLDSWIKFAEENEAGPNRNTTRNRQCLDLVADFPLDFAFTASILPCFAGRCK
jgi:hypothetical protein